MAGKKPAAKKSAKRAAKKPAARASARKSASSGAARSSELVYTDLRREMAGSILKLLR